MSDVTKARLAQKRAEDHSKTLAAQMEARNAAISEFGAKIGAPLDFSQGSPVEAAPMPPPMAKVGATKAPASPDFTLPQHPKLTRAEEDQLTRDEAEAERLEYEAAIQAAGVKQPQVNPADFRAKPTAAKLQHKKPSHPLLAQLRSEFGIDSEQKPPTDVKVADHIWTFVPLSPEMISLTARLADNLSQTSSEHAVRSEHAAVCCSIVACDGVPVWMMLGLEPTDKDDVSFPLLPKGPIRTRAAYMLYGVLVEQMKNRLIDVLYEAYVDKVDQSGEVKGYTAYDGTENVVWVCQNSACRHTLNRPRRFDEENNPLPYYCELHGLQMFDITTTKPRIDEALRPLG